MKIRVEMKDGEHRTITLVPPIEIFENDYEVPDGVAKLTHLHCGDGTDHYFYMDSGQYDGWGRAVELLNDRSARRDSADAR